MMKRVFIGGGAGYIGARLVPELLRRGYEVTVADLLWFGNSLPDEVIVLKKDLFHITEKDLQGFDAVIFLAGLSNDPMAEFSPALNFISNGASPAYLAYIARSAGVPRYVYASSCSVYGLANTQAVTEEDIPNSKFPYGSSKLGGEFSSLQLADEKFSVISLRQGTVSGYSPRIRFDLIINTMYMKAMTEAKIVVNNPVIWRPILAISDAVNAYIAALEAPTEKTGIYNVASFNATVGDVGQGVAAYFKEKLGREIEVEQCSIPDKRNYCVSNEKAINILGATFSGSLISILDELAEHYGADYNFSDPTHYNIQVFKQLPKSFTLE